jgi:hypothetical protein
MSVRFTIRLPDIGQACSVERVSFALRKMPYSTRVFIMTVATLEAVETATATLDPIAIKPAKANRKTKVKANASEAKTVKVKAKKAKASEVKIETPIGAQGSGGAKGYVRGDTLTFGLLPAKFAKTRRPGASITGKIAGGSIEGHLATDSTTNRVKINGHVLGDVVRALSKRGYTAGQIVNAVNGVFGVPIRPAYASSAPHKKGLIADLTKEQLSQCDKASGFGKTIS